MISRLPKSSFVVLVTSLALMVLNVDKPQVTAFENADAAIRLSKAEPDQKPSLPVIAKKLESGNEMVRIVCFGDSVTGLYYHTGGRRTYTDMLGIALKKAYPKADVAMINAGISGNTTQNALRRIESDVLKHKPDLVTVMFGLNDMVRVTLDEYRKNLVTIIKKCRSVGADVLLCTPNSVSNTPRRPTTKLVLYCDVVRSVAGEHKVPLCDTYRAYETVRNRDALAWRLLMSDPIHPNMDGHKRIAEEIAYSISGKRISLDEVVPPSPGIPKTLSLLKSGKPVNILAMPPFDKLIARSLKKITPSAELNVTQWPTEGQTVSQLEQYAENRVRKMKPDLVVIAVPYTDEAKLSEAFIHAYAWIMNWSLSFGKQEWDCIVIHPSVVDPRNVKDVQDSLVRKLIKAQDLSLIDRDADDRSSTEEILEKWLKSQWN